MTAADPGDNRDLYRLLVENIRDYAIYLLDVDGTIRSWNPGGERIKGYRADEVLGKHFAMFFTRSDAEAGHPQKLLAAALRDGRVEEHGWRVRKDGSQFWADAVITALRDQAGKHVGFAKVTRDLTDHSYRRFVEASNSIVWTTDAQGRPNADSPTWRAFTGQSEEDWFGRHQWSAVHPDDVERSRVAWDRAKSTRARFEVELRVRRSDGVYQWMAIQAVPLLEADGTVREWFGVTTDVSARKRAEQELQGALARWTTTLRSIGDGVISTDAQGRVTFVNPVAEKLTGWSEADALGRPLVDIFPIVNEETRARVPDPVQKVLEHGRVVGLANHTVLVGRDGTDTPIDDSAAPIRDAEGALVGVVLVFRDVSEEKKEAARRAFLARAGEALQAATDYRDALATVVRLAVPRLADWCAIHVLEPGDTESRQLALAHVDPAKVSMARELARRYPPDPNAKTGVPNVIRTGQSEIYPIVPRELLEAAAVDAEHLRLIDALQLHSGMVVPLRGRERVFGALSFVYAESGRQYGPEDLEFAEDLARRAALVIERRKLEEERVALLERERDARNAAELANRAKDEFLATVSHELRTPLNAILGWTVMLQRKSVDDDVARHLAVIERNARAQARLIDDVLDLSRIISGKLRLDLQRADVREAVSDAVESVRPAAEAKRIAVVSSFDERVGALMADPDRLRQIVWNLLSNAVKFTPDGGHVEVEVRRDDGKLRIVVRDSGPGIEPAMLSAIFEPFRQVDASTTRAHGGLGLGLAIVRQLVTAHGGTVRAESAGSGAGATFVVELPLVDIPPMMARRTPDEPGRAAGAPRLAGLKVLVVDDEPDALELVGELLVRNGAKAEIASSAQEALARFAAVRPDVVVSDIGMPHVDGYTLVRRIRALPAPDGGRTPAVALTAYAGGDDVRRAFAAGFQAHVPKPVDPDHLVAVVANVAGLPSSD